MKNDSPHTASFRDPSGFVFTRGGEIYRQVNSSYRRDYDMLMGGGLYEALTAGQLLIPHEQVDIEPADSAKAYKIIKPQRVDFISYPYEWCFSQLKAAALATLEIQKTAMEHGMSLKDASAYNIQFHRGRAVLIDTLSFEPLDERSPWVAYGQFCRHFLAPLAVMKYRDVRLAKLLGLHIDGLPLDIACSLLPWRTRLRLPLLAHLHTHAMSVTRHARDTKSPAGKKMGKLALRGIVASLRGAIKKLTWKPKKSQWCEYYDSTNYTPQAMAGKKRLVGEFLDLAKPKSVWDLGANTGLFSKISADRGITTIAFDSDIAAVEKNYRQVISTGEKNLLPLVVDLTNPSTALGWAGGERMSLAQRGPADTILALALVHHLAISNNVTLESIAEYFSRLGASAIMEVVPKTDPQVAKLLVTRKDIFDDYHQDKFESAFKKYFSIEKSTPIPDTSRTLYLLKERK